LADAADKVHADLVIFPSSMSQRDADFYNFVYFVVERLAFLTQPILGPAPSFILTRSWFAVARQDAEGDDVVCDFVRVRHHIHLESHMFVEDVSSDIRQ
jgi:hypothetical protein